MRFTLRQLSYFVAVGETGSITLASERIRISQPSVSSAISSLESEFGVQLFFRHHAQGLSLTPAGERLLEAARNLLRQAEGLGDLANEITTTIAGSLRVGAFRTLAPLIMPGLCMTFRREYPKVEIHMFEGDEAELYAKIRKTELDIAFTYEQQADDINFEKLTELPTYVLLPSDHPLAEAGKLKLSDLAHEPFVMLDLPVSRDYFRSLFEQRNLTLNIAARSEQPETVRSFVASGFGFSLLTARPASTTAPNGQKLSYITLDDNFPPMKLGIATAKTARGSRTLRAFQEHCRRYISQ